MTCIMRIYRTFKRHLGKFIGISVLSLLYSWTRNDDVIYDSEHSNVLLIWWTPFIDDVTSVRQCGNVRCSISDNRDLLYYKEFSNRGYLFYGSNVDFSDLPTPRDPAIWWSLLHEESPKNQPLFCSSHVMKLFNFTSTFRQTSHEPLTLQYLKEINYITEGEYLSTSIKNAAFQSSGASVVYIQSTCDTLSNRDAYVNELSKYIQVSCKIINSMYNVRYM